MSEEASKRPGGPECCLDVQGAANQANPLTFIHTHQVLSLVHLPSPIYSAVAFYPACSVLYSCATEEGPFGAETFCLLVKSVPCV